MSKRRNKNQRNNKNLQTTMTEELDLGSELDGDNECILVCQKILASYTERNPKPPASSSKHRNPPNMLNQVTPSYTRIITDLSLEHNNLTDKSATVIAHLLSHPQCMIMRLELNDNQISDEGGIAIAKALAQNSSLTELDLYGNQLGPSAIQHLSEILSTKNTTLERLYLGENPIGPEGALSLARMLQQNSSLDQLDLFESRIGNTGGQAIGRALAQNESLSSLDMDDCNLKLSAVQYLCDSLFTHTNLRHLDIGNNPLVGPEGSYRIAKVLKTRSCQIEELELGNIGMGNSGARHIAEALAIGAKKLTHLNLSVNKLDSLAVQELASALRYNNTLLSLNLSGNHIRDAGAVALSHYLSIAPKTKTPSFSSFSPSSSTASNSSTPYLSNTNGGENNPNPKRQQLITRPSLAFLLLVGCKINEDGGSALASAMRANKTLRKCNLSRNVISFRDWLYIREKLRVNRQEYKRRGGY